MTALRNPYLSTDSQNYLLRKNYNVIKSPTKQSLYQNKVSTISHSIYSSQQPLTVNNNSQSHLKSLPSSTSLKMKNPFSVSSRSIREQSNQENFPYYKTNLPTFYTQPYLPTQQQNQLPFPSYNRPQSRIRNFSSGKSHLVNNSLANSRKNLALSSRNNIQSSSSLDKNFMSNNDSNTYRPHFVSPQSKNVQWNTDKWKKEMEKEERKLVEKYGPESLRYEGKLTKQMNSDYYQMKTKLNQNSTANYSYLINGQSISKTQTKHINTAKKTRAQQNFTVINKHNTTHNSSSSNNSLSIPRDPDTYHHKSRPPHPPKNISDIKEQSQPLQENFSSKIEKFNHDEDDIMKNSRHHQNSNSSMMEDYKSFVKDKEDDQDDFDANKFLSKYQESDLYGTNIYNAKRDKGPLDLDAFDNSGGEGRLMDQSKANAHDYQNDQKRFGSDTFAPNRNKPKIIRFKEEQSSVVNQYYGSKMSIGSKLKHHPTNKRGENLQNVPQKDHPQKIEFRNQIYYRIKLGEQNKREK